MATVVQGHDPERHRRDEIPHRRRDFWLDMCGVAALLPLLACRC